MLIEASLRAGLRASLRSLFVPTTAAIEGRGGEPAGPRTVLHDPKQTVGLYNLVTGAIGKMALRGATHRMAAGIDAHHDSDRAELSDSGVDNFGVVHDVTVVAKSTLDHRGTWPDLRIAAELAIANIRGGVDHRCNAEFHHVAITQVAQMQAFLEAPRGCHSPLFQA